MPGKREPMLWIGGQSGEIFQSSHAVHTCFFLHLSQISIMPCREDHCHPTPGRPSLKSHARVVSICQNVARSPWKIFSPFVPTSPVVPAKQAVQKLGFHTAWKAGPSKLRPFNLVQ